MKKRGRPKKINNGRIVTLLISNEQYYAIDLAARNQSMAECKLISFSEMTRQGLESRFPVNKTLDMFKD